VDRREEIAALKASSPAMRPSSTVGPSALSVFTDSGATAADSAVLEAHGIEVVTELFPRLRLSE